MKNILIVDDQPENLQAISEFFAENNLPYNIIKSLNGYDALKLTEKKVPDLIITDWEMPGMDGIEFIKQLRTKSQTVNVPIIMCTGVMITSDHLQTALQAGATDYIRKPVDPIELLARTSSILKITELQKDIIEQKNKELADNSIYLIQNNKFHEKLVKDIQDLNKSIKDGQETDNLIHTIMQELDTQLKEESWNRFDIYFQRVHQGFQKNLLSSFPNLSASELRLCIFLRMGMNTKDLSVALSMTDGSIRVSRSRLREKFNLQREENLTAFLLRY